MTVRLRWCVLLVSFVLMSSGRALAAPTLTILSPGAGAVIGDQTLLSVRASSPSSIASVVAVIGGHSAILFADTSEQGTFRVLLPTAGLPRGWLTLSVTATDGQAQQTSRSEQLLLDRPPVITVTSPAPWSVRASGVKTVHITATCADDTTGGCHAFRAINSDNRATLATGVDSIDVTATVKPGSFRVDFQAVDSLGQHGFAGASVEEAPALTAIVDETVGLLIDADATRLLSTDTTSESLIVRDRLTGNTQVLPPPTTVGSLTASESRLTPHGVFTFVLNPEQQLSLYEWRDGAWLLLDAHATFYPVVRGHFAAWVSTVGNWPPDATVYRRDLESGQTITVDQLGPVFSGFGDIDVSETGTVSYVKPAGTSSQVWRSVDGTPSFVADGPSGRPRGDATLTAFTVGSGEGSQVLLATSHGETPLTPLEQFTAMERYAVAGEWSAFSRGDTRSASAWLRRPDGTLVRLSSAQVGPDRQPLYEITSLQPTGHVVFHRHTYSGFDDEQWELFDAPPGRAATPLGRTSGETRVATIDGAPYVLIGRALLKILPAPPRPLMTIDTPKSGSLLPGAPIAGWALDRDSLESSGIDTVHVWATPLAGGAPRFVGAATMGVARPDVATAFGPQYATAGFSLPMIGGLAPGAYRLTAYAHSAYTNGFAATAAVTVTVPQTTRVFIDTPLLHADAGHPFVVAGWALDLGGVLTANSGVDVVQIYAYPDAGAPVFLGTANYGIARPDVGAAFGSSFTNVGYGLTVTGLPAGHYVLAVFARSSITGRFAPAATRSIVVGP